MPIATKILCPPTAPRMWSLFGLLLKSTTKLVFSKPRCPVGSRSALCPMNRKSGRGRGIREYFVNFVRPTLNTCNIRSSLPRKKPALIPTILALPLGASSYEWRNHYGVGGFASRVFTLIPALMCAHVAVHYVDLAKPR